MSISSKCYHIGLLIFSIFLIAAATAHGNPALDGLIDEALKNSPEIKASQARIEAARMKVPQAGSLPDPMLMFGYQNEGFDRYTYGEMQGSQWMFSATQQFLFPGKRKLREEMAARDAQSLEAMHELLKLKTAARVRELYFDLFAANKNLEILGDKRQLLARIEELTLSRYAAGKAMQQDVVMAQTEKYMLLEKEEMLRQKIQSLSAMLIAVIGRTSGEPIPGPAEPQYRPFEPDLQQVIAMAVEHSPEIQSRRRMIEAAESRLSMARREYFPDFAISGSYFNRSGDYKDMWAATATFNIPVYFLTRQKPAEMEARAGVDLARREMDAVRLMIESTMRDNFTMVRSSERLIEIYSKGLIPQSRQDIEQTLTAYATGRLEAVSVIARIKTLLDYESLYWTQRMEREKALARLHAVTAGLEGQGAKK